MTYDTDLTLQWCMNGDCPVLTYCLPNPPLPLQETLEEFLTQGADNRKQYLYERKQKNLLSIIHNLQTFPCNQLTEDIIYNLGMNVKNC